MSSWLDSLPSNERMKIRKRMRSEAEYERLRESVKGPEDLERELEKQDAVAEASFDLQSEPALQEATRAQVQEDIREQGIDAVLEAAGDLPPDVRSALEEGKFSVVVESLPDTHEDRMAVVPEGNVSEKIPLVSGLSEQYISGLSAGDSNAGI